MNIFEELETLYSEIDDYYAREELAARRDFDETRENEFARKRELNDHAYYLFMFTRFEDHIREQSSKLIKDSQDNILNWEDRRPWDILPSDKRSDKLFFLNRVALLVDKGSHHYQSIKNYYDLRNTIGHGGNFSTPVPIPTVVNDFNQYAGMLNV
jgi:hypothetical protein